MSCVMALNEEMNGIELSFDKKPDREVLDELKQHGFRWHGQKKIWYARQNEDRLSFAENLVNSNDKQVNEDRKLSIDKDEAEEAKELMKKVNAGVSPSNRICDYYHSVGDTPIYEDSRDVSIFNLRKGGYFKDLNVFVHGYADSIKVTFLDNAQKRGETCDKVSIYTAYNKVDDVQLYLANELDIHTVNDLCSAIKKERDLGDLEVSLSSQKGIETFSPFIEQKPIKTPKKWTKAAFQKALMSGQIFKGNLDYRYTDDYAYDAAYNFGEGRPINVIATAKDVIEGYWSKSDYLYSGEPDKDGVIAVSYSDHSTSKTFLFLESCTLKEAQERQLRFSEEKEAANIELKEKCITVSPENIDLNKLYTVSYLDKDMNTDLYSEKTEIWQGGKVINRLDLEDFTKMDALEIEKDKLYDVSNFYYRMEQPFEDDRLIDMGNWNYIVSGQALLEFTAEGEVFPNIKLDKGCSTFEKAEEECQKFINGEMSWGVRSNVDYEKSLAKLETEKARVANIIGYEGRTGFSLENTKPQYFKAEKKEETTVIKPSIDSLIGAAKKEQIAKMEKEPEVKLRSAAPVFQFEPEK